MKRVRGIKFFLVDEIKESAKNDHISTNLSLLDKKSFLNITYMIITNVTSKCITYNSNLLVHIRMMVYISIIINSKK